MSDASPKKPTGQKFFSTVQAARMTGWSLASVKAFCRTGKIKAELIELFSGREVWRIPASEVARMATRAKHTRSG